MQPLLSLSRVAVLGTLVLGVALPLQAQLSATSPFQPPQAAGGAAPTQANPLEFAGYFTSPEGMVYVVRDPAKKTSVFLKANERDPATGVVVKQYNSDQNSLVVEQQGRPLTLEAKKAKIISSGAPQMGLPMPVAQPAVATNVTPAVTQTVVLNPTPADEQKRLEAVASEVARRRALREQAAGAPGQPPQPPPANVNQPQARPGQPMPGQR